MSKYSRRDLFKMGTSLVASIPLISVFANETKMNKKSQGCTVTKAPEGVRVIDENTSKRLKYVSSSTTAGQSCANCKWYKPKKNEPSASWAKCSMAGNKYVSSCGWCKQYKVNKKKS